MSTHDARGERHAFLAVGHVCVDQRADGSQVLGGAAWYAGHAARALGLTARIVTSAGHDYPGARALAAASVDAHIVPSDATTTFAYEAPAADAQPGARTCALTALASTLNESHVPHAWRDSPMALVCPVWHEVEASLPSCLRPSVLGLAPQGFLRQRGDGGRVRAASWSPPAEWLARASAIFLSEHDAPDAEALAARWADSCALVVVTRGAAGSTLFTGGGARRIEVATPPANEVDSTGAGDVFATTFVWALHEGASPTEAAAWASAAGACCVEGIGVDGIAELSTVAARRTRT